jgi:hypothetical protein
MARINTNEYYFFYRIHNLLLDEYTKLLPMSASSYEEVACLMRYLKSTIETNNGFLGYEASSVVTTKIYFKQGNGYPDEMYSERLLHLRRIPV